MSPSIFYFLLYLHILSFSLLPLPLSPCFSQFTPLLFLPFCLFFYILSIHLSLPSHNLSLYRAIFSLCYSSSLLLRQILPPLYISPCHSPITAIFPFLSFFCLLLTSFSHYFLPSHFSPFPFLSFASLSSPARYPALWHQDSNRRKPRVDLWPGVYGWPDQAGLLLLPLCLQAEAGELRERPVAANQLHLPAWLWGHSAGLQDLRVPLVSNPYYCTVHKSKHLVQVLKKALNWGFPFMWHLLSTAETWKHSYVDFYKYFGLMFQGWVECSIFFFSLKKLATEVACNYRILQPKFLSSSV